MKKGDVHNFKDLQSVYEIILEIGEEKDINVRDLEKTIQELFPSLGYIERAILAIQTLSVISIFNSEVEV